MYTHRYLVQALEQNTGVNVSLAPSCIYKDQWVFNLHFFLFRFFIPGFVFLFQLQKRERTCRAYIQVALLFYLTALNACGVRLLWDLEKRKEDKSLSWLGLWMRFLWLSALYYDVYCFRDSSHRISGLKSSVSVFCYNSRQTEGTVSKCWPSVSHSSGTCSVVDILLMVDISSKYGFNSCGSH